MDSKQRQKQLQDRIDKVTDEIERIEAQLGMTKARARMRESKLYGNEILKLKDLNHPLFDEIARLLSESRKSP